MENKDLSFLKGSDKDKKFHLSRVMFCIKDGEVKVASENSGISHIEWFEEEGWIASGDIEKFFNEIVRGFDLPRDNELYCYRGAGWEFENCVLDEIVSKITDLKQALDLDDETEIHLGPKDTIIAGKEQAKKYVGTLKEIVERNKR
jgi:hypothetical protein